jgi:hypothetical protein
MKAEDFRKTSNILTKLSLTEDKGHLDHPEDLIFLEGSTGASRALRSILDTVKNPHKITIKFDGYPALIFGRNSNGRFSIMDKHMFNKKDGSGRNVFSPEEFMQYDRARGVDRRDLYRIINELWAGLDQASKTAPGYYWGDLLFSKPLQKNSHGLYQFKANPNGITYTVQADSEIGNVMAGKNAGIAVHQFLSPDAMTTDQAQSLDGTIGQLTNNSDVAIVPSAMPTKPKLSVDPKLVQNVNAAITRYGKAVDQMMDTAPQSRPAFNGLFTTYINKKIVSGNLDNLIDGFMDHFENKNKNPGGMEMQLSNHFYENEEGLVGAFTIWIELYKLKMNVVTQLNKAAEESPVKGYLQDGTETHEGFVSNGLKFVDRMGFSRQNLAARR